ncbi:MULTISPECIES: hypothetical protein [unclassified Mesorhizobium]|uniref:hypothetical protein n=1 Tax=unclassified Mesorhizobium TaxID=325217 RepID=UPI001CCE81CA|nr:MULTISPECIES: hypothetical protein [unclassified Mesorhizobium]MBZ9681853.1 hypothetical protein [Mesorhizobium sp. CO1-1-2]MBZ9926603.1 hypothetical protein [Mesorhizobium sp. BR1-1-4]
MKPAAKRRGSLRKVLGGIAAAIATTPDRRAEQGASTASMVAEWPLPPSATLGSSLRLKGIEREVRARLPWTVRKFAKAETGRIVLRMLQADADAFQAASATISRTLEGIEALAVLPREAEDILTISSRERHKWLRDGRLKSIGTRTVKMRGRSKAVTFHVFDPRHIEDVLDRDLATAWREEDAREISENRRRGAGKAALTRAGKRTGNARKTRNSGKDDAPKLEGWDTFEAEGLLR